ncbi:MAG: transcriptional regulator [Ignavibacteria bacterium]|nr:transcriptional regulator [Ignavibacteria bacterium]
MEKKKLVTIVTESILEKKIAKDVLRLGAHGYTITEASGQGERGMRSSDWEQSRNIRVEVVCDNTIAETIIEYMAQTYYEDYAMIVFVHEVEVVRPEKF